MTTLTREQLKVIWETALETKHDFEQFETLLSGNLDKKIQEITQSHEYVMDQLVQAIADGDFQAFETHFKKGVVDINAYYLGGNEERTLLQLLIEFDKDEKTAPTTINRVKMTRYLLDKGANVNEVSCDIGGFDYPTPAKMSQSRMEYKQGKQQSKENTWNYLRFTFFNLFTQPHASSVLKVINEHITANPSSILG